MTIEYYIGIDFGHGETSVSRIPGSNGEAISRIPLKLSSHIDERKVISAICRQDDGWRFVSGKDDFKRPDIREGFKAAPDKLDDSQKQALVEFVKLVFDAILKNDPDLRYDPKTGDANFAICIANPSRWRRDDPDTPRKYLELFRTEAGLLPAKLCINESDAAFYTKFDKTNIGKTVFVIDLGSSTIDFTLYSGKTCIPDACDGDNLGAHQVEEKLVEIALQDPSNKIQIAQEARIAAGLGNVDPALLLAARMAKEQFYVDEADCFDMSLRMTDLVPGWPVRTERAIELYLSKDEFNNAIEEYRSRLKRALENQSEKLKGLGISPTLVILSGGASRMTFVRDLVEEVFPGVEVYKDTNPEWVVSDGAAKYIKAHDEALKTLLSKVSDIDFKSIYINADKDATQEATKAMLPSVISDITGSTDYSVQDIGIKFCEFFYNLDADNTQYVSILRSKVQSEITRCVTEKIREIIKRTFNIDVDMSDVNVDATYNVLSYPIEYWSQGNGLKKVVVTLEKAVRNNWGGPDFAWTGLNIEKPRDLQERRAIADYCKSVFSERDPWGMTYNEDALEENARQLRKAAYAIAKAKFYEKELFSTSIHK